MNEKFNYIKKKLGNPFYQNNDCLIYNMDSLEGMNLLNENIIDLTITSPPYNIGKEYENILKIEDYIKWTKNWINNVYNLTKPTGAMLLNLGYVEFEGIAKAIPIPYLIWDKVPFYLIQEIVWNYGAGVSCKHYLSPRNEKWLWYVKSKDNYIFNLDDIRDKNVLYPNQKKNGKLRCNSIGKNPSDVWQIAKITSGEGRSSKERTKHPAQFPIDLIERIVKGFSNPGDLILDPFIGSGSTALPCINEKRKILGFEINKEYCSIISNRIENHIENKLELFDLINYN